MIVAGRFGVAWAYLLGPLTGGALGALLYNKFLVTAHEPGEVEATAETSRVETA